MSPKLKTSNQLLLKTGNESVSHDKDESPHTAWNKGS